MAHRTDDVDGAEPAKAPSPPSRSRGVPPWIRERLEHEDKMRVEFGRIGRPLPPKPGTRAFRALVDQAVRRYRERITKAISESPPDDPPF